MREEEAEDLAAKVSRTMKVIGQQDAPRACVEDNSPVPGQKHLQARGVDPESDLPGREDWYAPPRSPESEFHPIRS
jgi:hypothetical protein